MSTTENAELVRTYFQKAWTEGDLDWAESVMAEGYALHRPDGSTLHGFPVWRAGVERLRAAFPDVRLENHLVIAEGDLVAVHSTIRATHRGEFFGVVPTGRTIAAGNADFYRIVDGRLVEHWDVTDVFGILRQLGALGG